MNEIALFAFAIAAVGIAGIYGIFNGNKNNKQELLSKANTDSVRGFAICMVAASHMAQVCRGGYIQINSFLMGSDRCFGILPTFRIW